MKKVKKYKEPFDNGVVEDEVVAYQRSLFESYRSRTKESQNVTYNKTDIINDDVQKVIKTKADNLSDAIIEETMISDGPNWRDLEFSHLERTVRIGTVFSGIGAIEHAFQRLKLKHKIVFAGDIDEKCKKSYFANYDISEENWFSDIKDFDARKYLGQVDFIVGGAPCQAFSMVGRRLGFEDTRGTLFFVFV